MNEKEDLKNETRKEKEPESDPPVRLSDSCFSKSICSATDCTGLIPALPSSEEELEAYEEMYQFCLSRAVPPRSPES